LRSFSWHLTQPASWAKRAYVGRRNISNPAENKVVLMLRLSCKERKKGSTRSLSVKGAGSKSAPAVPGLPDDDALMNDASMTALGARNAGSCRLRARSLIIPCVAVKIPHQGKLYFK